MDFFDKMGEELNQMGNDLIRMTKETAEGAKLRAGIAAEKGRMLDYYRVLGEQLYQKYKDDESALESMGEIFVTTVQSLKASEEQIKKYKEELVLKKGGVLCPSCGAMVDQGASFCQECGCSMKTME